MNQKNRLKSILDFIAKQEESAARELSLQLQKQRNTEQQIEHLQQYRKEYASSLSDAGLLEISKFQNQQNFLVKLNAAMEQQQKLLTGLQEEIETRTLAWQKAKSQREGLEKLMQGYQEQAQTREERRLQIELDTHAGRGNL